VGPLELFKLLPFFSFSYFIFLSGNLSFGEKESLQNLYGGKQTSFEFCATSDVFAE